MAITFTGSGIIMADGGTLTSWGDRTSSYFVTPNGTLFNFMTVSPPANALTTYSFNLSYSSVYTVLVSGITEANATDRYCMMVYSYSTTQFTIRNTMTAAYPVNVVAIGQL